MFLLLLALFVHLVELVQVRRYAPRAVRFGNIVAGVMTDTDKNESTFRTLTKRGATK